MASSLRPYIHELYGQQLLISWPGGQYLHEEGMQLFYTGDYISAMQMLDQAIINVEIFSKNKDQDMAILLSTKASVTALFSDSKQAESLILRAQGLATSVVATNSPLLARIQTVRATVLVMRGNFSEATAALQLAAAALTKDHLTNKVAYALVLQSQALIHMAEGHPAEAFAAVNQSSEIINSDVGKISLLFSASQYIESLVAFNTGHYETAMSLCESSLTILTNCVGREQWSLAAVRNTLSDIYQQLGMYGRALPLLEENLHTQEIHAGSDIIVVSTILNSLGLIHYRLAHYAEAEQFFRRCLLIRENNLGTNSPAYAAVVNNLALVLDASGQSYGISSLFKDACLALEKSLGKNSPDLATVLLNWGNYSRRFGESDIAKPLFEEAFWIRDKAFGKNHPAMAEAVEAYAQLQCDLGDFRYADQLASLAFSIKTNFFGINHLAMAESFDLAGRISEGMGNETKAAQFYLRGAAIRSDAFGMEHPAVANGLEKTGLAMCRDGEYDESVRPFLMALRSQRDYAVEQVARKANGDGGLRLAGKNFYRIELFHSLCALGFSNTTTSLPKQGAEQLASCKALLEEIHATQASLETDSRTSTRELCEKLDANQNQLARLSESNLDPAQRDHMRWQLQSAKTHMEEGLAERNGLVAQTILERNLTLSDIAQSLPHESALVDFIQYQRYDFTAKTNQWKEQRYAAYLTFPLRLNSTNLVVERVELGEAEPINEAVGVICNSMSVGQFAVKSLSSALQRLSNLVYGPLARHLTNVSQLIICPDGQLSRLPFEMLLIGNKFLVEEKTISYVTSGREVARLVNQNNSKSRTQNSISLVIGNPDFDLDLTALNKINSQPSTVGSEPRSQDLSSSTASMLLSRSYRGMEFNPLPGSGVEATNIAKILGDGTILRLGADAREAELKTVVSPRVLHLATHGFFLSDQEFKETNSSSISSVFTRPGLHKGISQNDWENPMVRCGIALAGANHALRITNAISEDGLLTGLEASLLNLQGTDIVILSACNSGKGEVRIGEGVMSLCRAFRIAGAQSVLASHWPVSDMATSRLMTEFMHRWRMGEPRIKAWREAQLTLLRSKDAKEDLSNPYFWSAFTLTGQWN